MEEVEKATKDKTEYIIASLHSSDGNCKDLPLQTTDAYLQPYINQLNVWKEINQLHQNHSLAMNRIVSLAEAKVVVEAQEEIKPPKSYIPSKSNDFEKEIDIIIGDLEERVDKPPEEKQVETEKQKRKGLFGFFKM